MTDSKRRVLCEIRCSSKGCGNVSARFEMRAPAAHTSIPWRCDRCGTDWAEISVRVVGPAPLHRCFRCRNEIPDGAGAVFVNRFYCANCARANERLIRGRAENPSA